MDQHLNRIIRNGNGIEILRAQALGVESRAEYAGLTGKRALARTYQEEAVGRRREIFELSGLEFDRGCLALSLAELSKWLRVPEELDSACYYAKRGLQILCEQRQRSSLSLQYYLFAAIPGVERLLETYSSTLRALERSGHRLPAL
jgi:hypothetical protein